MSHVKTLATLLVLLLALAACGTNSTAPATSATHTPTATAVPTATPTITAITHGTPRIGGPISDFYGRYGTPNNQGEGQSETWITSTQLVNATPDARGNVQQVSISLVNSQPANQMIAVCAPFLPPGASQFNATSSFIDYHSSIGEIVMLITDGSCVLSLSQS